jgi:predicted lactoylglutathione lyase
MTKQIYVNLPVKDLSKATAFYEALGFSKNPMFSDENAASMMWSDEIVVMLLTQECYKGFLRDKEIADTTKTSSVLLAISLDSKEEVQKFADTAKANGGDFYKSGPEMPEEMMFSYDVEDLDGHVWEPMWMNLNFDPHAAA